MSSEVNQKRTFSENFIRFFDRWTPNSMIIAYILTAIVAILALIFTDTPFFNFRADKPSLVGAWGQGFWSLLELAMQMSLILLTGSLIASSPPVRKFLQKVAMGPNNMFQAVLLVMAIVPLVNWFHFGLGIMTGIHLGRQVVLAAKRKGYKLHNPLFVAFLYGCGITGVGISQIAPIYGASRNALRSLFRQNPDVQAMMPEVVPLTQSALTPQNAIMCILVLVVVFATMWFLRPRKDSEFIAPSDDLIAEIEAQNKIGMEKPKSLSPADRINNSYIPSLVVGVFGLIWTVRFFIVSGRLDFNNFNMIMLIFSVLLSGSPNQFIRSVQAAIGSTWGIIIQFPFYAGIFGLIAYTGLNEVLVNFFMSFGTKENWPFITFLYTAIVNIAVPSGGPKFFVVAPYVLEVAARLDVNIGTILVAYVAGDCSIDGFLPFWALPYMAMFKTDFRKILPYTAIGTLAGCLIFSIFFLFIF